MKTAPKLVKIFVRNINGKSPGKTEKKNSLTPLIVPLENSLGLQIITTIIKKTKAERQRSLKSFERLKVKNKCEYCSRRASNKKIECIE